jgi:hypothetical protein
VVHLRGSGGFNLRGLKLITYLFLGLSLSSCSMLDKVIDNVATFTVGSGASTAGGVVGYLAGGPTGYAVGSSIGAGTGAVLAEAAVADKPPPTWIDVIILAIEVIGWGLLLVFLLPWVIGLFHDKPTIKKKPTELGSRAS